MNTLQRCNLWYIKNIGTIWLQLYLYPSQYEYTNMILDIDHELKYSRYIESWWLGVEINFFHNKDFAEVHDLILTQLMAAIQKRMKYSEQEW